MSPSHPTLSLLETRILGVLVEKELTVPDTYPLSLNALTAGCNQKSNRDPVIDASETDVLDALDRLRSLSLVIESLGSRVTRYAQNIGRVLQIPSQAVALLTTLMLRGPQTIAELRANSERLHRFADASSVEAFLTELAERSSGALVVELPRMPGARETRWTHLLSGMPEITAPPLSVAAPGGDTALAARVAALENEIAELRAELQTLYERLDALDK
ncbi:MAG: YceH family protein [Betaproteobacteria bacterium]|nr:YceH family protein [Betaproteobacteria bacterium]